MADNITIDLDTLDDEKVKILKQARLGNDIDKKLEIHKLTSQKANLQESLHAINERLAELRK